MRRFSRIDGCICTTGWTGSDCTDPLDPDCYTADGNVDCGHGTCGAGLRQQNYYIIAGFSNFLLIYMYCVQVVFPSEFYLLLGVVTLILMT